MTMNDTIQNTIAEVFAIEDSGVQIKLRDKNKRSLGSFFKAKKDGNPTQAYQQFQDMEIKSGSVVEISFKEVPFKDGMIKNIIGFREAAGRPLPQQKTPLQTNEKGVTENSYKPVEEFKPRNYDREAYEKCCSIWAASWLGKGDSCTDIIEFMYHGGFWELFQAIRKDGATRFETPTSDEDSLAATVPF